MVTFNELNIQNHRILELSNVLEQLITDRGMCDNQVTAELFFRYLDAVKDHLDLEDKQLYAGLLVHSDIDVNNTAKSFLSGSLEIKKIFNKYMRKWCKKEKINIQDHAKFLEDTNQMFKMVQARIQDESEHLYPLIRRVSEKVAA